MSDKWARARFILQQNPTAHLDHDQSLELLDERDELAKERQVLRAQILDRYNTYHRQQRAIEVLIEGLTHIATPSIYSSHQQIALDRQQCARSTLNHAEPILKGEE